MARHLDLVLAIVWSSIDCSLARRLLHKASSAAEVNTSSKRWPDRFPWNEIDQMNKRVLGEGSFGIVARYYTTCSPSDSVVVKAVKQDPYMSKYERMEQCREATSETQVQMLMAEKDKAVRIFDMSPKACDEQTLERYPYMDIMMGRALGDGDPDKKNKRQPDILLMLDIAKQLWEGLNVLHSLGYLHRDIKPANLLYESEIQVNSWEDCQPGECRFTLSDYGLACKRASSYWKGKTTCTEQSCGTPLFVPPEIAKSVVEGDRTEYHYGRGMDYWALGVTLFKMWTHQYPGNLGGEGSLNHLMRYIQRLGTRNNPNWWKESRAGRSLDAKAAIDDDSKIFRDILAALLLPDRTARTRAVNDRIHSVMDTIQTKKVSIPSVCVDPCSKCSYREECRAEGLRWECVASPHQPVIVRVFVLVADEDIYGTWFYKTKSNNRHSYKITRGEGGKPYFVEGSTKGELHPIKSEGTSDRTLQAKLYNSQGFVGTIQVKLSQNGEMVSWMKGADASQFGKPIRAQSAHREPVEFDLGKESAGKELRDLKVLVKRHFGINVEHAAFFLTGSKDPIADTETLEDGDDLYLSPPLRHAMLYGPQIGRNLADAVADAKRASMLVFPYLQAAENILRTWPASRWSNPPRALRSGDFAAQAALAAALRPHVEEAQKFFSVRLTDWYDLLDRLSAPLKTRMQQDRERHISETNNDCQKAGLNHCAREVHMEMPAPVDYVKVEYTQGDVYTKLKFFRDGRIIKTRGDEVAQGKPLKFYSPILPGGLALSITLCKDLMSQDGFDPIRSLSNFFVRSESRCEAIGEQISYQLTADRAAELPQERLTERKKFKFQVSANPEVYFQIWDGDFVLGDYKPEMDSLDFEVNVPNLH